MQVPSRCLTVSYQGISSVLRTKAAVATAYDTATPPTNLVSKKYNAIWDTGATNTVITRKVVQDGGLATTGVAMARHGGGESPANTYLVSIFLPNKVVFPQVRVTQGILPAAVDLLIGMDIIGAGDFAVTNHDEKTVFSYKVPSAERIDFAEEARKEGTFRGSPKIGRNALCPCGSGKKYKNCCLAKKK